ncbi:MAG TPA: nucleotidyltransferase family protein [Sphingomicrobium sp.]|nr:nucleotidyltransferase family protein [Sphingomicrobium sp.]
MPETAAPPSFRPSRLCEDEVRQRLAQAVRQGTPQWLWPDRSVEQWESALLEIERAVRHILSHGRCEEELRGEPEDIGLAGYTSGLGPLLGYWLSIGLLSASPAVSRVLRPHYRHNAVRMRRLGRAARRAVDELVQGGISVTVLKGMHTAFTCFPTPGARPMSDIDVMISPEDKAAAEAIFRRLGFVLECERSLPDEQTWRCSNARRFPQSLSLVHRDDSWTIDLHTSANRRSSAGGPVLAFDDIARRGPHCRSTLHPGAQVLRPAAAILFLACHAGYQFQNLRLVRLVELVLAIRHAQQQHSLCWEEVVGLGAETATLSCAYPAFKLADALAPGTVPVSILRKCEQAAPNAVVRLVAAMRPATAQRLTHCSMEERYMWASTWQSKARQFLNDLVPFDEPLPSMLGTMRTRFWRIIRRRVIMRSSASRSGISGSPSSH